MENKFVAVKSASDWTLVIDVPHLNLHRVWTKRNQSYPIERQMLIQAYYEPSVEALFRDGSLVTTDKDFLREIGLLDEEENPVVYELTEAMKQRLIKFMPISEVKKEFAKMSSTQIEEVIEYAIVNYKDLSMDRIDLFKQVSGRNVVRAIENYRAAQEG